MISTDPASDAIIWEGSEADIAACAAAVARARAIGCDWARADRIPIIRKFAAIVEAQADGLARDLSIETGKPLWESRTEIAAIAAKVELSIAAQAERAGTRETPTAFGRASLTHRPHGVLAVLGPFNFPGHLPNGHIVPALLAGNTVVFKPSEETPLIGERLGACWRAAGLPPGVLELVQGGRETGAALIAQPIDGLLFTGSAAAGAQFRRIFAGRPEVMLALELGGNNALIAWDGDPEAVGALIVQSAYLTAGQRCSCARRLIVPEGRIGDAFVDAVAQLIDRLRIGAWNDVEEPFMGPLISAAAARRAMAAAEALGGRALRAPRRIEGRSAAFLTPALIDATAVGAPDEEIFAPVLQIFRAPDFDAAVSIANRTRFGLAAGLISNDDDLWARFSARARAGVINRNRPTTGASSALPFGGIGDSGNHRPGAYYAADYCAYPVAGLEAPRIQDLTSEMHGLIFQRQ